MLNSSASLQPLLGEFGSWFRVLVSGPREGARRVARRVAAAARSIVETRPGAQGARRAAAALPRRGGVGPLAKAQRPSITCTRRLPPCPHFPVSMYISSERLVADLDDVRLDRVVGRGGRHFLPIFSRSSMMEVLPQPGPGLDTGLVSGIKRWERTLFWIQSVQRSAQTTKPLWRQTLDKLLPRCQRTPHFAKALEIAA